MNLICHISGGKKMFRLFYHFKVIFLDSFVNIHEGLQVNRKE